MDEAFTTEAPVVERARRLFALSAYGPFVIDILTAYLVGMSGYANEKFWGLSGLYFVLLAGIQLFVVSRRNKPDWWRMATGISGLFAAGVFVLMGGSSDIGEQSGLDGTPFVVIILVCVFGILLLAFLPVRSAARLVLSLSSDVVDSSFEIHFIGRRSGPDMLTLSVTPDLLRLEITRFKRQPNSKRDYLLQDIDGVSVRTEKRDREFRVPGWKATNIKVSKGEVVAIVFMTRDTDFLSPLDEEERIKELVFPTNEAERIKRFIERRVQRAATASE
jgi:hypothetical protein